MKILHLIKVGFVCLAMVVTAAAQSSTGLRKGTEKIDINQIIRAVSSKEFEFRRALNNYSFKREVTLQTIGIGGAVTGEYQRISNFVFDDKGRRVEKIVRFPVPTITEISVTSEDIDDFGGIQAFALEPSKIDKYNFTYAGKEKIDELDLYVFDVSPKVTPDPKKVHERYFSGKIWVDEKDLQIVKAKGKGIPEGKQRFPIFETYREHIDGKYWFPTYSYADDELVFPNSTVHIRMRIKYSNFQEFRGKVKITEIDEDTPQEKEEKK
jgi:hypothetical protein